MQKENPTEAIVSNESPVPAEDTVCVLDAGISPAVPAPDALPSIEEDVRPAESVPDDVIAVRTKIVTRLDALKEYVCGFMNVERYRDGWDSEEVPPEAMLEEAELILSYLREITVFTGLEEDIADEEEQNCAA